MVVADRTLLAHMKATADADFYSAQRLAEANKVHTLLDNRTVFSVNIVMC